MNIKKKDGKNESEMKEWVKEWERSGKFGVRWRD
jgi:SET domain-containing protein